MFIPVSRGVTTSFSGGRVSLVAASGKTGPQNGALIATPLLQRASPTGCGPHVRGPQDSWVPSNPLWDGTRGGFGHEGGAFTGMSALLSRGRRPRFPLSAPSHVKIRPQASPHQTCGRHLDLGLPASRTGRSKCLRVEQPSVWHPRHYSRSSRLRPSPRDTAPAVRRGAPTAVGSARLHEASSQDREPTRGWGWALTGGGWAVMGGAEERTRRGAGGWRSFIPWCPHAKCGSWEVLAL